MDELVLVEDLALLNVKARDVHEAGAVPWNFDIADFVHCGVSFTTFPSRWSTCFRSFPTASDTVRGGTSRYASST